jgi:hypothetical protein
MTKKKSPTLKEQVAQLERNLTEAKGNQEILEETMAVLEQQIAEQGWISLFGGQGKELSKQALNTLYDLSRVYWLKNPLIKRPVDVQALYVFAQGMTIKGDHPMVDVVVQRLLKDRKNIVALSHQARMALEMDLRLGGNLFLALFTDSDKGRVIVRMFPLYEIQDIITNPEDRLEPWYYRRDYWVNKFDTSTGNVTPGVSTVYYPDWQYNPKDKPEQIGDKKVMWDTPIMHVRTNHLPDWKFGVPELYSAIDWAQAYKRFLENWSKLVDAYARFAFSLTTKGGARAVAAGKAKIEAVFAKKDPNLEMSETDTIRQRPVGATLTASEGVKLDTIRTQGATTSADDARRLMLMVCSASGIPEQIEAGDPSTGNLATAKAMERPLELQFKNRQQLWMDILGQILDYAIDQAIACPNGLLKENGEEIEDDFTGETRYELNKDKDGKPVPRTVSVKFPPILEHDILAAVQAIVSGATLDGKPMAGTMDLETIAQQVLKALNVENADAILMKIFPPGGVPIMHTENDKARIIVQLLQATGVDPWALIDPEKIQILLPLLSQPSKTTNQISTIGG